MICVLLTIDSLVQILSSEESCFILMFMSGDSVSVPVYPSWFQVEKLKDFQL